METEPPSDLFFLNGWNEWAEGNHLEPDQKFGLGFLEELRRVRNGLGERTLDGQDFEKAHELF